MPIKNKTSQWNSGTVGRDWQHWWILTQIPSIWMKYRGRISAHGSNSVIYKCATIWWIHLTCCGTFDLLCYVCEESNGFKCGSSGGLGGDSCMLMPRMWPWSEPVFFLSVLALKLSLSAVWWEMKTENQFCQSYGEPFQSFFFFFSSTVVRAGPLWV